MEIHYKAILIFSSFSLIFEELYTAKVFCETEKGNYSFNFWEFKHYCDEKEIAKYSDGWNFVEFREKMFNFSVIPRLN